VNAIAIGASAVAANQAAGSIVLNATGTAITATQTSTYVAPIRNDDTALTAVCYNTTTKELTYATTGTKTFVIDHPTDAEKYLVHACLEGPEAGVYYRGEATIEAGKRVVRVALPAYAAALATDFTVHITPILKGEEEVEEAAPTYYASRLDRATGTFTVCGPAGEFFWQAVGRRAAIEVEPRKDTVEVKGSGPYRWI
jgi:hypothetical protein